MATFYQSEKVVAVATMRAKAIKMNLFKRLRKVNPEASNRFIPIKNIAKDVVFIGEGGAKFEGEIKDLSLHGISATFPADSSPVPGEPIEFLVFVENVGFISGKCEVKWLNPGKACSRAGFQILSMSKAASDKWHESIKNFTFLNTRRDAF